MQKEYINKIREYVGDMSQVAGIKSYTLLDGKSNGVRAVDFWTGSGLNFTVILDRCMDISQATYKGRSLCWRSPAKEVHPHFYEPQGFGWVKGFFGGLVTTCGLTHLGAACIDQEEHLGLHGRVSYIPAEDIRMRQEWEDTEYVLSVEGRIRQVSVFGENLILTRKITAWLGRSEIKIEDKVENVGYKDTPFMMLYHINTGFPIVTPESRFVSTSQKIAPRDDEAKEGIENFDKFTEPSKVYKEKVYYHDMKEDDNGLVRCAVISEQKEEEPFGLSLVYTKKELPQFVQWKMLENQNYALGIEPSNCWTEGRDKEREWGALDYVKPGEERTFSLKFGILSGRTDIDSFTQDIQNVVEKKSTDIISREDMISIKKKQFKRD